MTSPQLRSSKSKPIQLPKTKPCSTLVLQHDFGYSYGKSPILAQYNPPSNCHSSNFDKIVLEWHATCKGRQFDRIFGLWLRRVELLRICTTGSTRTGIVWTIKKDITRETKLGSLSNKEVFIPLAGRASCYPELNDALTKKENSVTCFTTSDDNDSLLDIYCRSDITALAKDKAYSHIRLDEMSIQQALQLGQDESSPFGFLNDVTCV